MKRLIPILCVTLSLTACSGPDSSGGVALSKDPYPTNADFPHGQCNDDHAFAKVWTGCGWMVGWGPKYYYIEPNADLRGAILDGSHLGGAKLSGADLSGASLQNADLSQADLRNANLSASDLRMASLNGSNMSGAVVDGVIADRMTSCPNGVEWRGALNNCGF